MNVTITLRRDDAALLAQAVEFEIEHTNDLIRGLDADRDQEQIIGERRREARLEAIREYIVSAVNAQVAA